MKTDRELLELAAKAAGIDYLPAETDKGKECELKFGFWLNMQGEVPDYVRRRWQPLTDDGDALRLAVKCGINISMDDCVAWYRLNDSSNTLIEECWGGDYDPCYRRAIVRAAAAIGETL